MRHGTRKDVPRTPGCGGSAALPALGVSQIALPRLRPATADLLRRQGLRQDRPDLTGVVLYLPRLGGCVLPHQPVGAGWICTFVATEGPAPVPTGVFLLDEVELRGGFAVGNPWLPHAELSGAEFGDVWAIRMAERWPDRPIRLVLALLEVTDVERLEIVLDRTRTARLMSHSGIRTRSGLTAELGRLARAHFLVELSLGPADPARFGLRVPPLAGSTDPARHR